MTLKLENRNALTDKDLKTLGSAVALDEGGGPDRGPATKGNRGGAPAGKAPKPDMTPHPLPGDEPEGEEDAGEEIPDGEDEPGEAPGGEEAAEEEGGGAPAGDQGGDEADEDEEGAGDEAPEDPQAGQEGQPRKKMGQKERLRARLKAEKERNAALEADLALISGYYPSAGAPAGQPSGQQAPAPLAVPAQQSDDPWAKVDDKTLRGVLDGTVAADDSQKGFAVAEFSRRVALNAVNQRFNDAGLQNARVQAEAIAKREYPECFKPGTAAKAIYDRLMQVHPLAKIAPDAPLLLAGTAIGRALRLGHTDTRKETLGLKAQVRRARASGSLESGSPAPQGQGARKSKEQRSALIKKAALSGRNWYRGKDTNRVVTDLL